jgi:hypothetical protein
LLINKPQFKRFEMHGSLPAVLQHGTVVSVSKLRVWGDLLLINKPQFKRFEMHGSLPAVLQHGTVVSVSKLHKHFGRRHIRQNMRTEFESRRAPDGGATLANTRRNTNNRYMKRYINK